MVVVCTLFHSVTWSQSLGTWSTAKSAPTERTEVSVAALEWKIYVIGGFNKPGLGNVLDFAISQDVEVYDPEADSWTTTTSLPEGRHHAGIATLNGVLYVVGGFSKSMFSVWKAVSTVYRYDPSTREWTTLAPMPTARGGLGVTTYKGELYAIGGYDGDTNPSVVEVFNPNSNSWRAAASLPTPRDHLAVVTVGERIYVIGGRPNLDYRRNMATVEVFDPIGNEWHVATEMPTARSGMTVGVLGNRIYVLGGESGSGTFDTNEAYLPLEDRWASMAPMPTARHGLGSAVVVGRLYVLCGGPTPGGSFSALNEVFSPPHPAIPSTKRRASAAHIGAVMAVLATFDEANVLPPEHDPQANQLIHTLIQLQSVVMKSQSPEVRDWVLSALKAKFGDSAEQVQEGLRRTGLTMDSLEAVVGYSAAHPPWNGDELADGFRAFNVRQKDWKLLREILLKAQEQIAVKGETLTEVFARRRLEMPGAMR